MPESPPVVASMTVTELKERLDRGDRLVVVDIREDDERAHCAISLPPTVVDMHLPMTQASARLDDFRSAAKSGPLVVYCHHGMRSMTVATWLAHRGVRDVYNLDGGIDAWSLRIDPAVKRY